jgi:hypothetical protein
LCGEVLLADDEDDEEESEAPKIKRKGKGKEKRSSRKKAHKVVIEDDIDQPTAANEIPANIPAVDYNDGIDNTASTTGHTSDYVSDISMAITQTTGKVFCNCSFYSSLLKIH